MNNLKISTVLISAFLAISLIIGFISFVGIRSINNNITEVRSINNNIAQIAEQEIPNLRTVLQMKLYAKDAAKHVLDYIKLNATEEKNEFYKKTGVFKTLLGVYKNSSKTSQEVELINQLDTVFIAFQEVGNELITIQDSQSKTIEDRKLLNDKIVVILDDSLQKNSNPSTSDFAVKRTALMEMEKSINEINSFSMAYLIKPDAFFKDKVKNSMNNFEYWERQLLATSLANEEKTSSLEINKYFKAEKAASLDIIALEDQKLEMLQNFENYGKIIDDILSDKLEPIAVKNINEVEDNAIRKINEIENKAIDITDTTFVAIIGSVISATVLGAVISHSISKPITRLRNAVKEMANGNLDIKVKLHGNEEISTLSESLNSMVDKLKTHDKLQKEFISIASHELRSPIQPILSFADLANKGYVSQDEAWRSVLTQARRLQRLANDILYVTRIESGELTYVMKKISINDVILDAVNAEKVNLSGGVSIETNLDKDIEIYADKGRLTQALTNTIGNAVKFTKKGYVTVESKFLAGENKIEIEISDTAGGIPKDILPKLFGKFVTKSIGNENQHGTGLGLFISKAIVTAHRGEIFAYNNNEDGATFMIVLPAK